MLQFHKAMTARRNAILNGEQKDEGFTLIELLIVVLIIGVLAAIAIPVYLSTVNTAKDESAKATVSQAISTLTAYRIQNGEYPDSMDEVTDFRAPNQSEIATSYQTTDNTDFCFDAVVTGAGSFYATETDGSPQSGSCTP